MTSVLDSLCAVSKCIIRKSLSGWFKKVLPGICQLFGSQLLFCSMGVNLLHTLTMQKGHLDPVVRKSGFIGQIAENTKEEIIQNKTELFNLIQYFSQKKILKRMLILVYYKIKTLWKYMQHSSSQNQRLVTIYLFLFFFFTFIVFRASCAAYGSSQARGQIGAIAASPHHSHSKTSYPSHICNLHYSSQKCRIFNTLSKARDRTRILMDTSWVHNPTIHNRISLVHFL